MSIRMETLEVGHVTRAIDGTKIEPEAQPALQRGHAAVMVNAGVINEKGGLPIITIPDVAAYVRERGGYQGTSKLSSPVIERHTTAGSAAQELTRKCYHCRSFDLDAIQSSRNLARDRNHVEMTQGFIAKGYSPAMADATARTVGMCAQHDCATTAMNSCNFFRPRSRLTRLLLGRKITNIMRAAQGKIDMIEPEQP